MYLNSVDANWSLIGDRLLSLSRLFADDTSLGYASQEEAQIKYVINHDLHELGDCHDG
jgi:hypothetical protein